MKRTLRMRTRAVDEISHPLTAGGEDITGCRMPFNDSNAPLMVNQIYDRFCEAFLQPILGDLPDLHCKGGGGGKVTPRGGLNYQY